MEPDAVEIRVLGCLIEKQRTTPDVYPLTLNALRLACNQSTNRDPVVDYDENTIRGAIDRLVHRKWATLASWSNRRSMKYRQTLDRAIELGDAEIAVLAVLMLRGPQTPGELKTRTDRLHSFGSMDELGGTLDGLIGRELVVRLDRRPGQREERYRHLLAEGDEEAVRGGCASDTAASGSVRAGRARRRSCGGNGRGRRRADPAHRASARRAPLGDPGAARGARGLKRSVSLVIEDGGRVLLVRRPDDDDDLPGVWGLPAASSRATSPRRTRSGAPAGRSSASRYGRSSRSARTAP